MYRKLGPRTIGMLLALYEHRVFTMGAVWHINSFDQWGVELGKQLAGHGRRKDLVIDSDVRRHDSSTNHLISARRKDADRRLVLSQRVDRLNA